MSWRMFGDRAATAATRARSMAMEVSARRRVLLCIIIPSLLIQGQDPRHHMVPQQDPRGKAGFAILALTRWCILYCDDQPKPLSFQIDDH